MAELSPEELSRTKLELVEHALRRIRVREDTHDAGSLYFPAGYDSDLHLALAESTKLEARRVVVCGSTTDTDETFADSVWREVSESDVTCTQVFVIGHAGILRAGLLDRLHRDARSGIESRVVVASDLDPAAPNFNGEQIIIDRSMLATSRPAPGHRSTSTGWTVTSGSSPVAEALAHYEALWACANTPEQVPTSLSLEEPLVESATTIAAVAPVLCVGDHIDDQDCSWYHGAWQYLRLLDLVSTPSWHHEFYSTALRRALDNGARTVCITGTADYSVLAYVLDAIAVSKVDAHVTVVDKCHTALFAAQWYAKRKKVKITTIAEDVVEFAHNHLAQFDIVTTDAFLTRFRDSDVVTVLKAWREMLSTDGQVITTIRAHMESPRVQTDEEAIRGFRERARTRWSRWEPFIQIPSSTISEYAEIYARRMVSNPIGSEAAISKLLASQFAIRFKALADVPGELFPTRYMRVILD